MRCSMVIPPSPQSKILANRIKIYTVGFFVLNYLHLGVAAHIINAIKPLTSIIKISQLNTYSKQL